MIEIILIIVGVVFIIASFFVQEKLTGKDVQTIADMSEKELNVIVEKELKQLQKLLMILWTLQREDSKKLPMKKLWQLMNTVILYLNQ